MAPRTRLAKARFVDADAPEPEWKAIHRVADRHIAAVSRVFDQAIEQLQARVSLGRLRRAVRSGHVGDLFDDLAFMEDLDPMADALADTAIDAVDVSAHQLGVKLGPDVVRRVAKKKEPPTQFELLMDLDATRPVAAAWAQANAAKWVTRVTKTTKAGIRELVRRAFLEGIAPRDLAARIRELHPRMGLTPQQATALANFEQAQIRRGVSGQLLARRIERKRRQLFRLRTVTIARHELMTASNRGQEILWDQAVDQKLLPKGRTWRVWIITGDPRTCQICRPMDGKKVKLGEPWQTSVGPVLTPQGSHVMCRCAESLSFEAP